MGCILYLNINIQTILNTELQFTIKNKLQFKHFLHDSDNINNIQIFS